MKAFVLLQIAICFLLQPQIRVEGEDNIGSEPQKMMKGSCSSLDLKNEGVEFYNGAPCQLRPIVVSTMGVNVERYVIPKCVEVMQCSGCCGNDESQCCLPTRKSYWNVTVLIATGASSNTEQTTASFIRHERCKCRPRPQGRKCRGDPVAPL